MDAINGLKFSGSFNDMWGGGAGCGSLVEARLLLVGIFWLVVLVRMSIPCFVQVTYFCFVTWERN